VSGTVDAPPLRVVWVKLPSGDVSMQSVTPCVFQKIEVRAPSGTVVGDAQISTFAFSGCAVVVVAFAGVVLVPPTVVLVTTGCVAGVVVFVVTTGAVLGPTA
jgi:hypothetical protein